MKLTIRQSTLLLIQRLLIGSAVFLFGYCAFVLLDTWLFQEREGRELDQQLAKEKQPMAGEAPAKGLIGRMKIERLGISVIVVEGTASKTLQRAAGHIRGTALPGEPGNIGISAHRDTFFRPLRNIKGNDVITVTTPNGEYQYRVVSTQIVKPTDVAVLKQTEREVLTLVTCYPFYFIGSAPDRFIVRAHRINSNGHAAHNILL